MGAARGPVPPAARRTRTGPARRRMPGCAECPRVGQRCRGGARVEGLALQLAGRAAKRSGQVRRPPGYLGARACFLQDRGPAAQSDTTARLVLSVHSPVTHYWPCFDTGCTLESPPCAELVKQQEPEAAERCPQSGDLSCSARSGGHWKESAHPDLRT